MGVYYCNVDRIISILNSFKLDNWSFKEVFEFMCNEDNDVEKYIIKMYLLSLLENHLHIDKLKFVFEVLFDKELLNGDEAFEIINRQEQKLFWDWLLLEKTSNAGFKSSFGVMSWITRYFAKYYYYNFGAVKLSSIIISDDENKRNEDKNKIEKELKNCLDSFGITIEHFNKVVKVAAEKVKFKYNIDETNDKFVFRVKSYVESFIERSIYIDKLGRDLIMNLMILRSICNSSLFEEKDMLVILKKIRCFLNESVKESDYTFLPWELDGYTDCYRDFEIKHESNFWTNITPFEDIPCVMNEFFENFSNVYDIEDDREYAVKCFELCQSLLQIHPYRNGNGRTSKYLLFLLLMRRGILPVAITDNHDLTPCYKEHFDSSDYFLGRMHIIARRTGLR